MILGIGCDILDVIRMERELAREEGGFRDDVFTRAEIEYCEGMRHPARHFAARFAAKEALIKALARVPETGLSWREMEITTGPDGEPAVVLHGSVRDLATSLKVKKVLVSLSHTAELATALVILESCWIPGSTPNAGTEAGG